jgi:hypothetical protein
LAYFLNFPSVYYNISGLDKGVFDLATNLLVRVGIIQELLGNVFNYYNYTIKDGETPEMVAENWYGRAESHWIVLLTNNIIDPQFNWPLDDDSFQKFIITKYGSISAASALYVGWAKQQITKDINTEEITTINYEMTENDYNSSALPTVTDDGTVYTIGDNSVNIKEYKVRFSAFDVEDDLNEGRRNIKLIKREYHDQIVNEFNRLITKSLGSSILRGVS